MFDHEHNCGLSLNRYLVAQDAAMRYRKTASLNSELLHEHFHPSLSFCAVYCLHVPPASIYICIQDNNERISSF